MKKISVICCFIFLSILSMGNVYAITKQQELQKLEIMLHEDKERPEYNIQTQVFQIVKESKLLTIKEKSKWIESHVEQLSSPFFLLNAVYLSQQKQYQKSGVWYAFGNLRLDLDVADSTAKCN